MRAAAPRRPRVIGAVGADGRCRVPPGTQELAWVPRQLSRRLEQLDRIAVRVLDLDLLASGTRFHVVPEVELSHLEHLDEAEKILDSEDDTVPSTRFLCLP